MDRQHRPAITERELVNNLEAVVRDADKTPPNQVAQSAVGVLTSENRRVWAGLRQSLHEHENNRSCLEIVDSALFVVCLDDTTPDSVNEMASNVCDV